MKNKGFNVLKARKNLVVLDYVAGLTALITILISYVCGSITRIPDVKVIFDGILIMSFIIFFVSTINVVKYYKKRDKLYNYV